MINLRAGYYSQCLFDTVKQEQRDKLFNLLETLSLVNISGFVVADDININNLGRQLLSFIGRGCPTIAPIETENLISNSLNLSTLNPQSSRVEYELEKNGKTESFEFQRFIHELLKQENFDEVSQMFPVDNLANQLISTPLAIARLQVAFTLYFFRKDYKGCFSNVKIKVIGIAQNVAQCAASDWIEMANSFLYLAGSKKTISDLQIIAYNKGIEPTEFYDFTIENTFSTDSVVFDQSQNSILVSTAQNYDATIFPQVNYSNNGKNLADSKETDSALNYLIRNAFREKSINKAQKALVLSLLHKKVTLSFSSAIHKEHVGLQLFSLINKGKTLIILPNANAISNATQALTNMGIDTWGVFGSSISSTLLEVSEGKLNIKNITNFAFSLLDSLFDKELMPRIKNYCDKKIFTLFVVDEAQCISEWSADFNPLYMDLPNKLRDLNVDNVLYSTSVLSPFVKTDVMARFDIGKANILHSDSLPFNIEIVPVEVAGIEKQVELNSAMRLAGIKKQVAVNYVVNDLFSDIRTPRAERQTLVFCPDARWLFGVTDKNWDGLSDKLRISYKDLKIGTFIGEINSDISKHEAKNSVADCRNFTDCQLDILVATPQLGIGYHNENIKHLIIFSLPSSPDELHRLINLGRIENSNYSPKIFYIPNKINIENHSAQSIDKLHITNKIRNRFRGKNHEMTVLSEILTEINFPAETNEQRIIDFIENEFGQILSFTYQPENEPFQLYVSENRKGIGHIDFEKETLKIDNERVDEIVHKNAGKNLLTFINNKINNLCPSDLNKIVWLKNSCSKPNMLGLLSLLETIEKNQEIKFIVPFRNRKLSEIANLLRTNKSDLLTYKKLCNIADSTYTAADFISETSKISSIGTNNTHIDIKQKIEADYQNIRRKTDTFTALARLKTIGIIKEFSIDRHEKEFRVTAIKKDKNEYIANLCNYLNWFISRTSINNIREKLVQSQNCLVTETLVELVSFAHDYVHNEHINEINALDSTIRNSLTTPNNIQSGKFIPQYYNTPFLLPSHQFYLENLVAKKSFDEMIKCIDFVGNSKIVWQQLLDSTAQYQQKNHHYILRILHSYSLLLLAQNGDTDNATDQLVSAFLSMKKQENYSNAIFHLRVEQILEKLFSQNNDLKANLDTKVFLTLTCKWLEGFNNQFLVGYE